VKKFSVLSVAYVWLYIVLNGMDTNKDKDDYDDDDDDEDRKAV
jgi:hypothetical protein